MKIVELQAENIKRLRAVSIKPDAEVSVADLARQLEDAREYNQIKRDAEVEAAGAKQEAEHQSEQKLRLGNAVAALKEQLAQAEAELADADKRHREAANEHARLEKSAEACDLMDLQPIQDKIATAEEHNVKVRANRDLESLCDQMAAV